MFVDELDSKANKCAVVGEVYENRNSVLPQPIETVLSRVAIVDFISLLYGQTSTDVAGENTGLSSEIVDLVSEVRETNCFRA